MSTMTTSRSVRAAACVLWLCAGCRSEKPAPAGSSDSGVASASAAPVIADKDACPESFASLGADDAKGERSCRCAAGEPTGKAWGSGIYALASSVCAAARHAGAITHEGGMVTLRFSPGCTSYPGSANNGVVTLAASGTDRSFHFPSVSDGKCPPPLPSGPCPKTFAELGDRKPSTVLACVCDVALTTGPVFGVFNYAEDSSICAAAVHAGVIPANGGTVTLHGATGCSAYAAATKNGVTSAGKGPASLGFVFPSAAGSAACATP